MISKETRARIDAEIARYPRHAALSRSERRAFTPPQGIYVALRRRAFALPPLTVEANHDAVRARRVDIAPMSPDGSEIDACRDVHALPR